MALVGASSLKGKEIKTALEEQDFPIHRLVLLDADETAGQLTEFAEEPAIIQSIHPDQFANIAVVFFACSANFTEQYWQVAQEAGCEIVDSSYFLETCPQAEVRAPLLEEPQGVSGADRGAPKQQGSIAVAAHPAAIAVAGIVQRLCFHYKIARVVATIYEPASERGQAGVDELHRQTLNLLSFQELPKAVFDAQVAFNLLWGYGERTRPTLRQTQARIQEHIRRLLGENHLQPALRLLQVPVFYGYSFCCFVDFEAPLPNEGVEQVLSRKPFAFCRDPGDLPNAVEVAGSGEIILGPVERDPTCQSGYWVWGAMDNLRLTAVNAVELARDLVDTRRSRLSGQ